jgi:hypothetical protein
MSFAILTPKKSVNYNLMVIPMRNLRIPTLKKNEKDLYSDQKNFTPSKSGKFPEPIPSQ